jgi:hypothetical protein
MLLSFPLQLLLICHVLPELEGVQVFTEDFEINIAIAPSPEPVEQIIELLLRDVEIVLEEEAPESADADVPCLETVYLLEGIVRLYRLYLLPRHFHDPQPL